MTHSSHHIKKRHYLNKKYICSSGPHPDSLMPIVLRNNSVKVFYFYLFSAGCVHLLTRQLFSRNPTAILPLQPNPSQIGEQPLYLPYTLFIVILKVYVLLCLCVNSNYYSKDNRKVVIRRFTGMAVLLTDAYGVLCWVLGSCGRYCGEGLHSARCILHCQILSYVKRNFPMCI